jgi:hypothetical protein
LRVHFTNPIVKLTIDKFLSQKKIEEYNGYLERKLNNKIPFLKIKHESSINDPCLQVADFIVGAFFQKYEHKKELHLQEVLLVQAMNHLSCTILQFLVVIQIIVKIESENSTLKEILMF